MRPTSTKKRLYRLFPRPPRAVEWYSIRAMPIRVLSPRIASKIAAGEALLAVDLSVVQVVGSSEGVSESIGSSRPAITVTKLEEGTNTIL